MNPLQEGSGAPTPGPSNDRPLFWLVQDAEESLRLRFRVDELLEAATRGQIGPVRVEWFPDQPATVYDEFGYVGYVNDEGFVVPELTRVEPLVCPTCGRSR